MKESMVENVRRAIYSAIWPHRKYDPEFWKSEMDRASYAAIAAMREPTEAMLMLGDSVIYEDGNAQAAWQAMLDAAMRVSSEEADAQSGKDK